MQEFQYWNPHGFQILQLLEYADFRGPFKLCRWNLWSLSESPRVPACKNQKFTLNSSGQLSEALRKPPAAAGFQYSPKPRNLLWASVASRPDRAGRVWRTWVQGWSSIHRCWNLQLLNPWKMRSTHPPLYLQASPTMLSGQKDFCKKCRNCGNQKDQTAVNNIQGRTKAAVQKILFSPKDYILYSHYVSAFFFKECIICH